MHVASRKHSQAYIYSCVYWPINVCWLVGGQLPVPFFLVFTLRITNYKKQKKKIIKFVFNPLKNYENFATIFMQNADALRKQKKIFFIFFCSEKKNKFKVWGYV